MTCPKCGKMVGERELICKNCGAELYIDTSLADKIFTRSSDPFSSASDPEPESPKKAKKRRKQKASSGFTSSRSGFERAKPFVIIACVVLAVILIVVLIINLMGSKGEKIAKRTADFIGADWSVAEKKVDAKFKQESAFKAMDNIIDYDRIAESDDSVRVDGIAYPEWAVVVKLDEQGRIESVQYCNFKAIKKGAKGSKVKRKINMARFSKNASKREVDKEVKIDPFSITYTKSNFTYTYRYWYENDAGDRQPVVLRVNYNTDNKYRSYEEIPVYHQYMDSTLPAPVQETEETPEETSSSKAEPVG